MRMRRMALGIAAAAGAVLGAVLVRRSRSAPAPEFRTGTFSNGIEYDAVGTGPRTMIFLPGGPGIVRMAWARVSSRLLRPLADAGFTVWRLKRRRDMPPGHTIADMADDVAAVIDERFGGHVDVVLGVSYGGLIGLYLAARHPATVGRLVLDASAATSTDDALEVDRRYGEALGHGRFAEAGEVLLEGMAPGDRLRPVRRVLGPLLGRMLASSGNNLPDVLVETHAEMGVDARPVLPQITAPVLIIAGDQDPFLPRGIVEETARLIPDCTLIWYEGMDHGKTATNKRVPGDVLGFVNRQLNPQERATLPGSRRQELSAESRKGLPGSFVELSAGVTHYEIQGEPEAGDVVLIHGNAAPYVTWDRTVGALRDAGFRVLRYDVFGHGFSDRPRRPTYDRHFYNVQLAELLSRLDVHYPVRLVGTSQGGSIATCFAAENPGAVSKLALLAPFFDELPGSRSIAYRLVTKPVLGELLSGLMGDRRLADLSDAVVSVDAVADLQRQVTEQFRYKGKRRAVLANLRGDALKDATACYREVGVQGIPLLLTCGTSDQKIPRASIGRLRELLPDIEYQEIDGAGHLAHYEFPDQINPILTRFLAS